MPEHCPFYVGQKVACIVPDEDIQYWAARQGMRFDGVYTIRDIGVTSPRASPPNAVFLRFKEIKTIGTDGKETGWDWRRFRPVTDISSLEALLNTAPTPVKQTEPA